MNPRTVDPGFDPRIADWLEEDPDHAPDAILETVLAAFPSIPQRRAARVPWRFRPMALPARLAAAAIAVAVVAAGGLLILSPGGSPIAATQSPSASASTVDGEVAPTIALLDGQFVSPIFGYSVSVPSNWTVHPATTRPPSIDDWGTEGRYDWLTGDGTNSLQFIGTVGSPPSGVTTENWIASARVDAARPRDCSPSPDASTIDVGGHSAVIIVDDCDRLGQYAKWSRAAIPTVDRIYLFQLDANSDPTPTLATLLRTLHLPETAR